MRPMHWFVWTHWLVHRLNTLCRDSMIVHLRTNLTSKDMQYQSPRTKFEQLLNYQGILAEKRSISIGPHHDL